MANVTQELAATPVDNAARTESVSPVKELISEAVEKKIDSAKQEDVSAEKPMSEAAKRRKEMEERRAAKQKELDQIKMGGFLMCGFVDLHTCVFCLKRVLITSFFSRRQKEVRA
jgi:hypothetical protein